MIEVPALAKVICDFLPAVGNRWNHKHIIVKFHDDGVTYFGDKQVDGVMRDAKRKLKARLWYELPVDKNRRVMASFKPSDSGGLPS